MALGVSKRKLNLGTTNTDALFLLLFSLSSLAYDDKRLSTYYGYWEPFCVLHATGSKLANWLTSFYLY